MEEENEIRRKVNYENVKQAVENGNILNINNQTFFKDENGGFPSLLYAAFDNRDSELMIFLLDQGIDPNILQAGRQSFFSEILNDEHYGYDIELIKKLITAGVDIEKPDTGKNHEKLLTPLAIAIVNDNDDVVELLIESGADLNPPCTSPGKCTGCSPLQVVARNYPTFYLMDLLLDRNVDVNKFCKGSRSALLNIAGDGSVKLVKRFLDRGVDTNLIFDWVIYPVTPLLAAIQDRNHDVMQLILDYEVTDVNSVNPKKVYSALHLAVYNNASKCLDGLLNANPDVNLVTAEGRECKLAVEMNINSSRGGEAREILKKHLVKLRAAGFYLHERNLAAVSDEKYHGFYAECCEEVDFMKKSTISSVSHVSFYDLLFMDYQKLALCLESLDDEEVLQSGLDKKFPAYAGMIGFKLKKAYKLVNLREELHNAVFCLFKKDLPSPIEEQIFRYFSIRELIQLQYLRRREQGELL